MGGGKVLKSHFHPITVTLLVSLTITLEIKDFKICATSYQCAHVQKFPGNEHRRAYLPRYIKRCPITAHDCGNCWEIFLLREIHNSCPFSVSWGKILMSLQAIIQVSSGKTEVMAKSKASCHNPPLPLDSVIFYEWPSPISLFENCSCKFAVTLMPGRSLPTFWCIPWLQLSSQFNQAPL